MEKQLTTLPEPFINRLRLCCSLESYNAVLKSFSIPKPTTLRINTLKISQTQFLLEIQKAAVELESVESIPGAFILKNPSLRQFSELAVYKNGWCYVQSLSSMLPPLVLAPQHNEKILDIAAAPGSKTSQIAALMENSGSILANDSSHIRIYKLKANLERLGVTNTQIRHGVGQTLWQDYPDYFDKALVDVPCSMEGRFDTTDPKSFTFWSLNKVRELSHLQRFLIRSAFGALKPNGILVYSTCTLSPEENEDVINWLLKKEQGKVSVEAIDLPGIPTVPGMQKWKATSYDESLTNTIRIYPTELYEGFFVAKLRKK